MAKVENSLPIHLLDEVEKIIFGWFDEFEERGINAFYKDNALYISPLQQSEQDLYDDIIHEVAHSLEGPHGYHLYADEKLKKDKFGRSSRVVELQDAYVLQRDVGYVYCERKRLFQIGLDSRLASNYHAGLLQQVEIKREEELSLPD